MTPSEFRAWRECMGYTQPQAAAALGVSLRTVKSWEAGFAAPPAFLALACAALAAGLGPWGDNGCVKPHTQIEILPEKSDARPLASLRGIAPEAYGGLVSTEYVEKVRNGEW